ncbi:hypothetical protein LSAT2_016609 [Lamellibrachia satsuma]|nr:hypothetical protein LSAT2_016609 [Lamellibrachia satsuma]
MVAALATTKLDMALVLLAPPSDSENQKIIQGVRHIYSSVLQLSADHHRGQSARVQCCHQWQPLATERKCTQNTNINIVTFSGEALLPLIDAVHAGKYAPVVCGYAPVVCGYAPVVCRYAPVVCGYAPVVCGYAPVQ